jgi:hypothetical protein
MKNSFFGIVVSILFSGAVIAAPVELSDFSSSAITIDFDSMPDGTPIIGIPVPPYSGSISNPDSVIDNEYNSLGVTFSSNNSGAIAVQDSTSQLAGISSPNALVGTVDSSNYSTGGPIFIEFVDPLTGLQGVTTQVGAFSIDVDLAPVSFTAFDFMGNELETVFFSVGGDGSIDFAGINRNEGISSVAINVPGTDFFAIDNLIFEPVKAVPVPPALILFASGLIGLIGIARRIKA